MTSVRRAPAGAPATTQQAHPQRKRSAVAEDVHGPGEAELISALCAAAAPLLAHGDRPRRGAGRAPPRRKRDPHVPSRRGAPVHETLEEPADHWGTAGARSRSARRTFGRKGHDPSLCWVALDGDEIVSASLADWKREGDWAGSACSASGARRRRGIAEALLTTVFGEFFRRGERCIALNVDAESAPARRGCM